MVPSLKLQFKPKKPLLNPSQDLFLPGVSEKRAAAPAEQSITKTEIALYVLLAVLAIAVAVLAAHCAVHHVKRKRYESLSARLSCLFASAVFSNFLSLLLQLGPKH